VLIVIHILAIVIVVLAFFLQVQLLNVSMSKVYKQFEIINEKIDFDRFYVDTRFDAATNMVMKRRQEIRKNLQIKNFYDSIDSNIKQIINVFDIPNFASCMERIKKDFLKKILDAVVEKGIINYSEHEFENELKYAVTILNEIILEREGADFQKLFKLENAEDVAILQTEVNEIIKSKTNSKNTRFLISYLNFSIKIINKLANLLLKLIVIETQKTVANLLEQGKINEALIFLKEKNKNNNEKLNEIVQLMARLSILEKHFNDGFLKPEDVLIEKQKLIKTISEEIKYD